MNNFFVEFFFSAWLPLLIISFAMIKIIIIVSVIVESDAAPTTKGDKLRRASGGRELIVEDFVLETFSVLCKCFSDDATMIIIIIIRVVLRFAVVAIVI